MCILADHQIEKEIKIIPFAPNEKRKGVISYGVSSYGYDARCGRNYKVFTNLHSAIIDVKNFDPRCFETFIDVDSILIPPHSFALAETVEWFEIPRGIMVIAVGKSTLARTGIIVCCTPIEPAFRGKITVEISNSTSLPCKIYSDEGIMQLLFFRGETLPMIDYNQKGGIYQDQNGLTLPTIRK